MKLFTLFLLFLSGCILTHSAQSLSYASLGLELWFSRMIPVLLPFMILSGIMVRLNLTERMAMAAYPVIGPLYGVRKNVCYCMLLGFLCGFPMGAKVTGELRERGMLTRLEGQYLLAFCNNIGPVYFLGFALPLLRLRLVAPYLLCMYGIPLLYGLLLRHTAYRDIGALRKKTPSLRAAGELRGCEQPTELPSGKRTTLQAILEAAEQSVQSSIQSILTLGGYMILFNLMNLVPHVIFGRALPVLSPLLEITGGLGMLQESLPLYSLLALSFGGLSCIAQTYSCIRKTDLSLSEYAFHKAVLTLLSAAFYLGWFLLLPDSFLH